MQDKTVDKILANAHPYNTRAIHLRGMRCLFSSCSRGLSSRDAKVSVSETRQSSGQIRPAWRLNEQYEAVCPIAVRLMARVIFSLLLERRSEPCHAIDAAEYPLIS